MKIWAATIVVFAAAISIVTWMTHSGSAPVVGVEPESAPEQVAASERNSVSPGVASQGLGRSIVSESREEWPERFVLSGDVVVQVASARAHLFWLQHDRFMEDIESVGGKSIPKSGRFAFELRDEDLLSHKFLAVVIVAEGYAPYVAQMATSEVAGSFPATQLRNIELHEGFSLGGRVLTKEGKNVAGVGLRVLGRRPPFVFSDGSELSFCTSDDNGVFAFPYCLASGPAVLSVSGAGVAVDVTRMDGVMLDRSIADHVVHVREAGRIPGRVHMNGQAIAGIHVVLGSRETEVRRSGLSDAWTASDGSFSLYADEERLHGAPIGIENPGSAGDYMWRTPTGNVGVEQMLAIETGGALLRVVDGMQRAQSRVAYELRRDGVASGVPARMAYSPDGNVRIENLLTGSYEARITPLEALHSPLLPATVTFSVTQGRETVIPVVLAAGVRLTFVLMNVAGGAVSGTRLWVSGEPLGLWGVPDKYHATGATDVHGRCELVVLPGRYDVLGRGVGHVPFMLSGVVALGNDVATDVVVSSGARIRITTTPPLLRQYGECVLARRGDPSSVLRDMAANGDGVFNWSGIPMAEWEVRIYRQGRVMDMVEPLQVLRIDEEKQYDVVVDMNHVIPRPLTLRLLASRGVGPGAAVSVFRTRDELRGGAAYCGVADETGRAIVEVPNGELRAATFDVQERRWLYSEVFTQVEGISEIDVSLRAFPLTAVVCDADGQHLRGATLQVVSKNWGSETVVTDESGRFFLNDGPCGEFVVRDDVRKLVSSVQKAAPETTDASSFKIELKAAR